MEGAVPSPPRDVKDMFEGIQLLDGLPFSVLLLDDEHHVLYRNRAAQRAAETTAPDSQGAPASATCADAGFADAVLADAVRSGKDIVRELREPRSGRWFECGLYRTDVRTPAGRPVWLRVSRDITDRKTVETERDFLLCLQAGLVELARITLQPGALEEQLGRMLECIFSLPWLELERQGAVLLVGDERGAMELCASRLSPEVEAMCRKVETGHCLCGRALESGQVEFAADLDERHVVRYQGIHAHGHYCVPIVAQRALGDAAPAPERRGEVLGVLTLYLAAGHQRNEREERFLAAAADLMAGLVQRRRAEAQLRHSQRLEALGAFAAGIAHDLNTVLTTISLARGVLAERAGPDGPPALATIGRAVDWGAAFVRRLNAFGMTGTRRVIDVGKVVSESEVVLRPLLGRQVTLRISRPSQALPVSMAPGQLEQLLLNLAANARDAMEGAGTLSIEVSEGATTGSPAAGIEGRYVAITVRDTGKGMADEVARKAFQAYFTTKEPDKGSGLGLAVVYGIVIEAGGTIEISSEPGEGATFRIRLPRA